MKKFFVLIMAVLLLLLLFGCSKKSGQAGVDETGPEKLSIWAPLVAAGKTNTYEENIAWQIAQKATNVELEFIIPPGGQEQELLNLMIAGDDLPDMIMTNWSGDALFPGGLDKQIKDGVIIRLNELVEEHAPDYLKCIQTFVVPEERKEFYTDSGDIAVFYGISPYEESVYHGIQYRTDWMEELGLENPETIDEVERVLTAFRDKKGAEAPLIFPQAGYDSLDGIFVTTYGIAPDFYQKNGTVMYGRIQPEFRLYLEKINDWYNKGLIDSQFPTRDEESRKRLLLTGEAGSIIDTPDSIGNWLMNVTTMTAGYFPVLKAGERVQFRLKNYQARPPYCVAITTACKNPEAAARFLNYGYTEPGWMLYNYGQEGETYVKTGETFEYHGVKFDKVQFTDLMMNNPEYSIIDALLKYKQHIGPFLRFEHEGNPTVNQVTLPMRLFWTEIADPAMNLPMISMTSEESQEVARVMSSIKTYADTALVEFIMGIRKLDTYDEYVNTIKRLEIDKAVAVYQAALERYNNR